MQHSVFHLFLKLHQLDYLVTAPKIRAIQEFKLFKLPKVLCSAFKVTFSFEHSALLQETYLSTAVLQRTRVTDHCSIYAYQFCTRGRSRQQLIWPYRIKLGEAVRCKKQGRKHQRYGTIRKNIMFLSKTREKSYLLKKCQSPHMQVPVFRKSRMQDAVEVNA